VTAPSGESGSTDRWNGRRNAKENVMSTTAAGPAKTMRALTYDRYTMPWLESRGLAMTEEPIPYLDPAADDEDEDRALIQVHYAGICGSDRGIWYRQAFGDMILHSLAEEQKRRRIVGHELLGRIVQIGKRAEREFGYREGQIVASESHIICGHCYQCRIDDTHVCARDLIMGISIDGCFAEYVKLPARVLWPTDLEKIRPEVAAIQEPFGNAVHACSRVELAGKRVAIFGCGPIGMFSILIARAVGATSVVAIEPLPERRAMARELGADAVLSPTEARAHRSSYEHNPELRRAILDLTDGVGVDVALEMSGFPTSVNNAIKSTRRGGHVILFGIKAGPMTIESFERLIVDGISLHSVIGRHVFETWEMTQRLLESQKNGIQEGIYDVLLKRGEGTVIPFETFEPARFEEQMHAHPKIMFKMPASEE
jgi:threonine 3-dehydrogenase